MTTRAHFVYGTSSVLIIAACSPGDRAGQYVLPDAAPRKLSARWIVFPQSRANQHVAVSGYSQTDIMEKRVAMQIDFTQHPELPARPDVPRRIDIKVSKPCSTEVCISPLWFRAQAGDGSITQDANGAYHLPDGSVWTSTDALYAGVNNAGPLEGYIYYGSNGSQWFAGSNNAAHPETMRQFQANQDAWHADNTDLSC